MYSGTAEAWRRAPICGGHDLSFLFGRLIYGTSREDASRVITANPAVQIRRGRDLKLTAKNGKKTTQLDTVSYASEDVCLHSTWQVSCERPTPPLDNWDVVQKPLVEKLHQERRNTVHLALCLQPAAAATDA